MTVIQLIDLRSTVRSCSSSLPRCSGLRVDKAVRCSSAAARPHALDRQMNGLSRRLLAVALNHSLRSWITCHANRRNNNPTFSFPLSMRAQFINNPQRKNKRCSMFNECLYIWDHTANLSSTTFKTKITPSLHISARMSWSISEILKPFKKLAIVFYQVNPSASPRVFKPDYIYTPARHSNIT